MLHIGLNYRKTARNMPRIK